MEKNHFLWAQNWLTFGFLIGVAGLVMLTLLLFIESTSSSFASYNVLLSHVEINAAILLHWLILLPLFVSSGKQRRALVRVVAFWQMKGIRDSFVIGLFCFGPFASDECLFASINIMKVHMKLISMQKNCKFSDPWRTSLQFDSEKCNMMVASSALWYIVYGKKLKANQ
jgi:hypothetical protein